MSDCLTSLKTDKIIKCATSPAGFVTTLNYAIASDFTATPTIPPITAVITNEAAGKAVGNYTPVSNAVGFSTISIFLDQPLEETFKKSGQVAESELKFRIQNNAAGKGFIRKFQHCDLLFAPEMLNGDFLLFGDLKSPAMISNYDGKNSTESYIEITIKYGPNIPLVWTGSLPMAA